MNRRSLLHCLCVLALLGVFVPNVGAQSIIVGGEFLNGNFDADTDPTDIRTFDDTPFWTNTGGSANNTFTATRTSAAFNGTRNGQTTDNPGIASGVDTGYTIQDGDIFNTSYVWRDSFQWDDAVDQMEITLFTTDDDTIGGARTDFATSLSGLSTANNTYQPFQSNAFHTVDGGDEVGKRLFVEFEGLDGNGDLSTVGFARIDNFVLSVGDSAPATTLNFTGPAFEDGTLLGQQGWIAEEGWAVSDSAGSGAISTGNNAEIATYSEPVTLTPGDTFSYSINMQFDGAYTTATTFAYLMQSGLRPDNDLGSLATGDNASADANIQMLSGSDTYRLLNNFGLVSGASNIGGTGNELDPGDELKFDYEILLGTSAATTEYTVRLQNLTDGQDTGAGTVTGIDQEVYDALVGDGAYVYVQRTNPNPTVEDENMMQVPAGTGLTTLQINSISGDFAAFSGGLAGDFNDDGIVNAADYTVWRDAVGGGVALMNDSNLGLPVGTDHYRLWKANFGKATAGEVLAAAPEPASAAMFVMVGLLAGRRQRRCG